MLTGLRRDRRAIAARSTRCSTSPGACGWCRPRRLDLSPLLVRDLAQSQGKSSSGAVGGELRVDRHVLETIKDPLIHLARNSLDHGIESREERVETGKSPRRPDQLTFLRSRAPDRGHRA